MNAETPGEGPLVDVYARLSYAVNGDEINVNEQIEWCSAEVVRRGGRVGQVFKDNSLSAWKPKVVRPDWNKLMARLESGASDGVIVLDLYRFSRKIMEGERLVDLASAGILVWSLSGSYDLTTADGRRHFREAIVAAAGESDKISERVKRGHTRGAKRGRRPGGPRGFGTVGWAPKPDGWEQGDPRELVAAEIVESEREVIRECYRRLLGGESLSSVVRDLRERDIRTVDGFHWQRFTLSLALRRPSMAGLRAHNGEIITVRKDMDPIVSREEWERLCALFDGRKRGRPAGRRHLLAGLVRCGGCGGPMIAQVRKTLRPYPDGSPNREYRCRRNVDQPLGCGKNYMDGLIADRAVAYAVKERLSDPRHADQVALRLARSSKRREELTQEITRLDETADNLAVKVGTWGEKRVDKAMTPILKRLTELNKELAALDDTDSGLGGGIPSEDVTAVWDEAEAAGDTEVLRAMVRRAFPALTLRPHTRSGDFAVTRFDWDGNTLPATS
ncbi:recombinase family protein [Amycolatopsis sp. lyj-108]|uniref:recombinase family protein n=1 Tax=Amycolatopsis sp. lyj-108 TaxID=2789286 RepID=UPI003979E4BE